MNPKSPESAKKPTSSARTRKRKGAANSTKNSKNSKPSTSVKIDPVAAARRRLDDLGIHAAPKLTRRIVDAAGGRSGIFSTLECDDSDDAKAFMEVYRSLPEGERDNFSLEEIYLLAGMTARRFGEVLMGAMMQQGADATRILIAAAQPDVSQALIRAATKEQPILDNKGELVGYAGPDMKAVELFGKMSGMLPVPKGSQTIINVQQLNQGAQDDDDEEGAVELESMDDMLLDLRKVTQKQLPPPRPTIEVPKNARELEYRFSEI